MGFWVGKRVDFGFYGEYSLEGGMQVGIEYIRARDVNEIIKRKIGIIITD